MIQLVFENNGKIIPEWASEQERLVFRLSPVRVIRSRLLHGQLDEVGQAMSDDEALGMVATQYEGDLARQVHVILELPDDVWDNLADQADHLL